MKVQNLTIAKETAKAVMVNAMVNHSWFDGDDQRFDKDLWLPKSQIKTSGNEVVEVADWIAREKDISIAFHMDSKEAAEKMAEKANKYDAVIERAKAAGIKGIRKGMRFVTILAKAKEQGIAFAI